MDKDVNKRNELRKQITGNYEGTEIKIEISQ